MKSTILDGITYRYDVVTNDNLEKEIIVLEPNSSNILCNITIDHSTECAYVEPPPYDNLELSLDYYCCTTMPDYEIAQWAISYFN